MFARIWQETDHTNDGGIVIVEHGVTPVCFTLVNILIFK